MHRRFTTCCVVLLLIAITSCDNQSSHVQPISPQWLKDNKTPPQLLKILGESKLAVLQGADRVESFRATRSGNGTLGYSILYQGPDLDARQLASAIRMTTRLESFTPGFAKACGFNPDVVLRFHQGEKQVNVVICCTCSEWYFSLENDSGNDGISRPISMDSVQADLLNLIRELFPDDERFKQVTANPQNRYGKGYLTPVTAPATDENARADIAMKSVEVLTKYIPAIKGKISNWSTESMDDCAYAIDGVLFVYTTKENHGIISRMDGVEKLP